MINIKIVQAQAEIEKHFLVLQSQFNRVTPVMLKNTYLGLPLSHSKTNPEKAARPSQTLLAAFRAYCLSLPDTHEGMPFQGFFRNSRSILVFYVRKKMFFFF